MASRNVKSEIDKRTTDVGKAAALQARKVAVLELVADLMQEAVDLMKSEGFSAPAVVHPQPQPSIPAGTTVITEAQLAQSPTPQVKNPCANCGQEASGYENMADGSKKYLCAPHYKARVAEKQEEATTKALMGSEGTLFKRATQPTAPVKKIIIQADPLLGNGAPAPPANSILADSDD